MFEQLGLIGCGLMGGSFALALKRAGLVRRVVGYSKSPSTTERARQLGVIDDVASSALLAVSGADIVLIAVPVAASEATFKAIRHLVGPDTLIMDVGSTKLDVVQASQALGERQNCFVPAHPIAGKEVAGIEHADADLYSGKQLILTPTTHTGASQLQRAEAVWRALGCRVQHMSAEAHDAAFASVSHLPHLLAFALMNAISAQPRAAEFLALAGPGFRDFTRIAASDPQIWRDILISNRAELKTQADHFKAALQALEEMMARADGSGLQSLITQASQTRASWHMNKLQK